jgi:excisionase family DNA binding protein
MEPAQPRDNMSTINSKNVGLDIRTNPPKIMNVAEAAMYVGISERYLRSLIADRNIKAARIGKRLVFRLVDLDRWIESKLEGGAS